MDLVSNLPGISRLLSLESMARDERRAAISRFEALLVHGMLSYATIEDTTLDQEQATRFLKSDLSDKMIRDAAVSWLRRNLKDFDHALLFQYRTIQARMPAKPAASSPGEISSSNSMNHPHNDSQNRKHPVWLIIAISLAALIILIIAYNILAN